MNAVTIQIKSEIYGKTSNTGDVSLNMPDEISITTNRIAPNAAMVKVFESKLHLS